METSIDISILKSMLSNTQLAYAYKVARLCKCGECVCCKLYEEIK